MTVCFELTIYMSYFSSEPSFLISHLPSRCTFNNPITRQCPPYNTKKDDPLRKAHKIGRALSDPAFPYLSCCIQIYFFKNLSLHPSLWILNHHHHHNIIIAVIIIIIVIATSPTYLQSKHALRVEDCR